MTEQEWLARYKQRFVSLMRLSPEQAEDCANSEPFADLSRAFEDDPEGCADHDMADWGWEVEATPSAPCEEP